MTCIVGYVDYNTDTLWMGGDSLGSNGFSKTCLSNKKIFKVKDSNIIIGYTDSFRMGQLLQYSTIFDELNIIKNDIDLEYMCTKFVDNIKSIFSKNNIEKFKDGKSSCGNFLVGINTKLYEIQSDYSVLESIFPFASIGCGEYTAHGALYSIFDNDKYKPQDKIRIALEASETFISGIQRPFYILNNSNDDEIIIK